MSLVLGKTVIATNTRCKYDANLMSSILSLLSGLSNLSDLSCLDTVDRNVSSTLSTVENLSNDIMYKLDLISSNIVDIKTNIEDAQFMNFNYTQTFNYISVGPIFYENDVDGWYYIGAAGIGNSGPMTTCFRMPIVSDPSSVYTVGTNVTNMNMYRAIFPEQTYVPVRKGTRICFPNFNSFSLTSTITRYGNTNTVYMQFIPSNVDDVANLSAYETEFVDFKYSSTAYSILDLTKSDISCNLSDKFVFTTTIDLQRTSSSNLKQIAKGLIWLCIFDKTTSNMVVASCNKKIGFSIPANTTSASFKVGMPYSKNKSYQKQLSVGIRATGALYKYQGDYRYYTSPVDQISAGTNATIYIKNMNSFVMAHDFSSLL